MDIFSFKTWRKGLMYADRHSKWTFQPTLPGTLKKMVLFAPRSDKPFWTRLGQGVWTEFMNNVYLGGEQPASLQHDRPNKQVSNFLLLSHSSLSQSSCSHWYFRFSELLGKLQLWLYQTQVCFSFQCHDTLMKIHTKLPNGSFGKYTSSG